MYIFPHDYISKATPPLHGQLDSIIAQSKLALTTVKTDTPLECSKLPLPAHSGKRQSRDLKMLADPDPEWKGSSEPPRVDITTLESIILY